MSSLFRKVTLPGLPPKPTASNKLAHNKSRKRDYTPVLWSQYYDSFKDVQTNETDRFRVYLRGSQGPVIFFLHGGGFSGLSWSLLSSFLIKQIECQCCAIDLRAHGDTQTSNDDDLSVDTLSLDIKQVIDKMWPEMPQIILVGHSMGGAIAIHVASREYVKNLVGVCVIDVVEGSAMEALSSMQAFLQGRPTYFNSLEHAIEYSVRSGQIRNVDSAKVSMIGHVRQVPLVDQTSHCQANESQSHHIMQSEIKEEEEDDEVNEGVVDACEREKHERDLKESVRERWTWRIDLTKTEKYWSTWFKGLSQLYLSIHQPKLLLLAGVDRLDKELMVGQMQGKFQMQILPQCGHAVHEDSPQDVANALSTFLLRNKLAKSLDLNINCPLPSC